MKRGTASSHMLMSTHECDVVPRSGRLTRKERVMEISKRKESHILRQAQAWMHSVATQRAHKRGGKGARGAMAPHETLYFKRLEGRYIQAGTYKGCPRLYRKRAKGLV